MHGSAPHPLLAAPPLPTILRIAGPTTAVMFAQSGVSIAEMYVVGRLGTAALVQAQDSGAARAILTPDRYADIEVHNWQFGGRPS